jgi:hypothetical protein
MTRRCVVVPLTLGLALAACGGDGGSGPSSSDLAGTWRASRMEFVNAANPSTKVEVIALGATLTVQLSAGGAYTSTLTMPGEPAEVTTGTWSSSTDVFTLHWTEGGFIGEMQFDWTLSASTLTLQGADSEFDFNDDGVGEAAKLNLVLVRQ